MPKKPNVRLSEEFHVGHCVRDLKFSADHRKQLLKHLPVDAVDALEGRCAFLKDYWTVIKETPTTGEIRSYLDEVRQHASALAQLLTLAHPLCLATVKKISHQHLGHYTKTREIGVLLEILSEECAVERLALTDQSRRQAPLFHVKHIADLIESYGVKMSASPESKFLTIVRLCFDAMGMDGVGPDKATRALIKERNDVSPPKFDT